MLRNIVRAIVVIRAFVPREADCPPSCGPDAPCSSPPAWTASSRGATHAGAPGPLLEELHAAGVRRIYVDGGAVIRLFLREGLIDDITLSIVPVLLGDGIPLFDASVPTRRLHVAGSRAFPSGLVQLRYDVTG